MRGIYGSIATAQRNLADREDAKQILKSIEEVVSPWLRVSVYELPGKVPPPEVPRAFNSSFEGCPVHGTELFKFGNYSWIMDPFENPWKLTCPVGGEEYPSNDFQSYLDSGMKDRSLLTGDYPDDGWGWKKEGEVKKHWFIAYYCHWYWYNHLLPAVLNLSRAFILTGNEECGRRCLVLLDKIAEFYPRMNYNAQSRYAEEFRPDYDGKIVNLIWETNVIRQLAEAVANVRPCISNETTDPVGKDPDQLIKHLEENILLEGLKGIKENRIRGNYGMHQRSALVILKALGRKEIADEWLDLLLDNPGGGYPLQGIRYAMDNFIYREGVAYENAPGYCISWTRNLLEIAFHLRSLGVESLDWVKLGKMVEAPGRMICQGHTPAIGDSGGVGPGKVELSPRYLALAQRLMPSSVPAEGVNQGIRSYEELFLPEKGGDERGGCRVVPPSKSDCMGGYGLALLRSGDLACSIYYGRKNGHGHFDRLGIELFGYGRKLTPDLGYPQFASESKSPPSWERNTISHNTVTVNEKKQETGSAGELRMFHSGRVEVSEVSAKRTYHATDLYIRTVGLIGAEEPFFFDIFRVKGGNAHDYSIHGGSENLESTGISMSNRPGTLAGPEVPYVYLYDDPELEDPEKERSFYSYAGSGFSYLYDLEAGRPGRPFSVEWGGDVSLRLFFPHPCQEVFFASGRPPLRPGNPDSLRYVILRNRGEELSSIFTAVGEVFRKKSSIGSVRPLKVNCDQPGAEPVGISVTRNALEYVILSTLDRGTSIGVPGVEFTGRLLVITRRLGGGLVELFMNGSRLSFGDWLIEGAGELDGRVESIDPESSTVRVIMGEWVKPAELEGKVAFFGNSMRSSSFKIVGAKRSVGALDLELESSGKIGRLRAEKMGECELKTDTELLLAGHGYYEGARIVDGDFNKWARIRRVDGGRILIEGDLDGFSLPEAFVWEFGPGDHITIGGEVNIRRRRKVWSGRSNVPIQIRKGKMERGAGPGRFYIHEE